MYNTYSYLTSPQNKDNIQAYGSNFLATSDTSFKMWLQNTCSKLHNHIMFYPCPKVLIIMFATFAFSLLIQLYEIG